MKYQHLLLLSYFRYIIVKQLSSWNGKDMDDALEDLHVHISADTFEKVDAAVAMVEPLLRPINVRDSKNLEAPSHFLFPKSESLWSLSFVWSTSLIISRTVISRK